MFLSAVSFPFPYSLSNRKSGQRVPNKLDSKRPTPRHIIITMTRLKDKERNLKATREKQVVIHKGAPVKTVIQFLNRNISGQKSSIIYSR